MADPIQYYFSKFANWSGLQPTYGSGTKLNSVGKWTPNKPGAKLTPIKPLTSSPGSSTDGYGYGDFQYDSGIPSYVSAPMPAFQAPKAPYQPYAPPKTNFNLPSWAQVPINNIQFQNATLQDLQNKYGFDYSPEYANRVAEMERQAKEAALNYQGKQVETNQQNATKTLQNDYFQKYLDQLQQVANRGMNGGIQADSNLRLNMNRQNALANLYSQSALQQDQIEAQRAGLPAEALQRANTLYQQRLQQAFDNSQKVDSFNMDYLKTLLGAAQANASLAMQKYQHDTLSASDRESNRIAWEQIQQQKQQFSTEQAWRQYQFQNMSATDRAQLQTNIQQYGDTMAWNMYEANLANQRAYDLAGLDASNFLMG